MMVVTIHQSWLEQRRGSSPKLGPPSSSSGQRGGAPLCSSFLIASSSDESDLDLIRFICFYSGISQSWNLFLQMIEATWETLILVLASVSEFWLILAALEPQRPFKKPASVHSEFWVSEHMFKIGLTSQPYLSLAWAQGSKKPFHWNADNMIHHAKGKRKPWSSHFSPLEMENLMTAYAENEWIC